MINISKFEIHNANYDKVMYYIDKMLTENQRYCQCRRCRLDAAAAALNTLPPHYYVELGHSHNKEMGSPWILIEVAVREAIENVFSHPNHHAEKEELARQAAATDTIAAAE